MKYLISDAVQELWWIKVVFAKVVYQLRSTHFGWGKDDELSFGNYLKKYEQNSASVFLIKIGEGIYNYFSFIIQ